MWPASCLFDSFFLLFLVLMLWFLVCCYSYSMMKKGPLLIFTASLPLIHKHTPLLLCSKLTGHILGFHAPWGSISMQCSVWKLLISTLSPILVLCPSMVRANCGHITLLDDRTTCLHPVVSQRLWPVIQYKTHQNRLFFSLWPLSFHCKSKTQIKPSCHFLITWTAWNYLPSLWIKRNLCHVPLVAPKYL